MNRILGTGLTILSAVTMGLSTAQADDAAAERARLANQRIQAEAERRAQAEQQRQEQVSAQAPTMAVSADSSSNRQVVAEEYQSAEAAEITSLGDTKTEEPRPGLPARGGATDMSQVLEQLRTLGELRDAGHVTETEFERIKARILENSL